MNRKIIILNNHREYRAKRRAKQFYRKWLFDNTAFERLNPEE